MVFDELCANFLALSENRLRIKRIKSPKIFNHDYTKLIIKKLPFKLTQSQIKVFKEINTDLESKVKECLGLFKVM